MQFPLDYDTISAIGRRSLCSLKITDRIWRFSPDFPLNLPAVSYGGFFFCKFHEERNKNMKTRRESREQAFVLLFEKSMTGDSMEDIVEMAVEARGIEMDPYCDKLTSLAELYLEQIDATIEQNIRGWSLRRLSKVTLSLLRVAVCEMKFLCAEDVPVSVSINEAVELAKIYGNEKDAAYVNGVLSSIAKTLGEAEHA